MGRWWLSTVAIACVCALVGTPARAAQEAPAGVPAGEDAVKAVSKLFRVFGNRVGRHDKRALDQLSPDATLWLFGTTDPAMLEQQLRLRFQMTIVSVEDVQTHDDGSLTAVVSFAGFVGQKAYQTLMFTLVPAGDSYLITLVDHHEMRFPEEATVAGLSIAFGADGTFSIGETILEASDYLLITVDNQDARSHALALYAAGADRADPASLLAGNAAAPGQQAELATVRLDAGDYAVVDQAQQGLELATLTIATASGAEPSSPAATPGGSTETAEEVNGFPVYPGAELVLTRDVPPCPDDAGGFGICDAMVYAWRTGDAGDVVTAWYEAELAELGWTCGDKAGEHASATLFSYQTTCTNGTLSYQVVFQAAPDETLVMLGIPHGDSE